MGRRHGQPLPLRPPRRWCVTQAPPPATLATYLHRIATHLETKGDRALDLATLLAARGYPTGGNGNGSRTLAESSSTERAALAGAVWDGIDEQIRLDMRTLWTTALHLEANLARVLAHASDDDPIPIGRGECQACGRFCKGDGTNDRLRSGFCHPCTGRWRRYRVAYPTATRSDFITDTKREQTQQRNTAAR